MNLVAALMLKNEYLISKIYDINEVKYIFSQSLNSRIIVSAILKNIVHLLNIIYIEIIKL